MGMHEDLMQPASLINTAPLQRSACRYQLCGDAEGAGARQLPHPPHLLQRQVVQ